MRRHPFSERQNDEESLRLLRARQATFFRASAVLIAQMVTTVALPIGGAIYGLFDAEVRPFVAFFSLLATLVDIVVLDRSMKRYLTRSAKIAEEFDCRVLDIEWNAAVAGERLDRERLRDADSSYGPQIKDSKLRDWYPVSDGQSVPLARFLCQRANAVYDSSLRIVYATCLIWAVVTILVGFGLAAFAQNIPFRGLALALVPAAPIVVWTLREYFRNRDVVASQKALKGVLGGLIDRVKSGALSEEEAKRSSRLVQDAHYVRRSASPVLLPGIYQLSRSRLEREMKLAAEDMSR